MDMTFPKGLIKAKLFDDEKSSELLKFISRIESLISDFGFDGFSSIEITLPSSANSTTPYLSGSFTRYAKMFAPLTFLKDCS